MAWGQLPAGIQSSGVLGGSQCVQPENSEKAVSSLCVQGSMQGQDGTLLTLLPNEVIKAVSVGAGAGTKSAAKYSLTPQLMLPAVGD